MYVYMYVYMYLIQIEVTTICQCFNTVIMHSVDVYFSYSRLFNNERHRYWPPTFFQRDELERQIKSPVPEGLKVSVHDDKFIQQQLLLGAMDRFIKNIGTRSELVMDVRDFLTDAQKTTLEDVLELEQIYELEDERESECWASAIHCIREHMRLCSTWNFTRCRSVTMTAPYNGCLGALSLSAPVSVSDRTLTCILYSLVLLYLASCLTLQISNSWFHYWLGQIL